MSDPRGREVTAARLNALEAVALRAREYRAAVATGTRGAEDFAATSLDAALARLADTEASK